MIAQIFLALASLIVPPNTVKSWAKHVDQPPVHRAPAGHHAVADDALLVHAEVARAVGDVGADLDERAGIEQQLEPLARGEAALGVDLRHALGTAAGERLLTRAARSSAQSAADGPRFLLHGGDERRARR